MDDDGKRKCCVCGVEFNICKEGVETAEGDDFCAKCATEDNVAQCTDCGEWHSRKYYKDGFLTEMGLNHNGNKVWYCENCGEHYYRCDYCNRIVNFKYVVFLKHNVICKDCEDRYDEEEAKYSER